MIRLRDRWSGREAEWDVPDKEAPVSRQAAAWTGDPDFVRSLQILFSDLHAGSWASMQRIIRGVAEDFRIEVVRETPPPNVVFHDDVPAR